MVSSNYNERQFEAGLRFAPNEFASVNSNLICYASSFVGQKYASAFQAYFDQP